MPTEFYGLILLLVVAVIFGYFYFKRAQVRDAGKVVERTDSTVTAPPPASSSSTANAADEPADTVTPADPDRRL